MPRPYLARLLVVGLLLLRPAHAAPPGTPSPRLVVDQLGYRPAMEKMAVLSDPQTGFNAAESYTPGALIEVREWVTNVLVHSGAPVAWNSGATHAQSGDKVWWFDFTSLRKWGEYYLYDPARDLRSDRFRIAPDVYDDALRHATRAFFYQRRGLAKQPPRTDPAWADTASHLGPLQDSHCRLVSAPANASLEKDLRGGWFDAGDYNKYVNFTVPVLRDLLLAYENQPMLWRDDTGIPESENGIPDLLDEVKWELDWLLRMQNADGSVLSKVAVSAFQSGSPPSADTSQIFYGAASTSATFAACGAFAQAAKAYASAGQTAFAATLRTAAENAWTWGSANPSVTFSNSGFSSANPEVGSYERNMLKLAAAIHLFALTGSAAHKTHVEANYLTAQPMQWSYWYAFESAIQDSLLYYAALPGVTASVASGIRNNKTASIRDGGEFRPAFVSGTDAYRAHVKDSDYVWGSNAGKARLGHLYQQQFTYNLDSANASTYRAAAEGYLHYLHGVNPLSMMFLTNLYACGGDRCANEMYHAWFGDGTVWDNALTSPHGPPPGYVTGGVNASWGGPDASYTGPRLAPPLDQPVQKSYRDWNTGWPQNSWEFTEPGIYYQSAYVRLVAGTMGPVTFADWTEGHGLSGAGAAGDADPDHDSLANLVEFALGLDPSTTDAAAWPAMVGIASHVVGGQPAPFLTATLPRQLGAGLTYRIEVSADLGGWTTLCTAAGDSAPAGPGLVSESGTGYSRTLVVRDIVPAISGTRFIRVVVGGA